MSPSAFKQDYRSHLSCVLYELGRNAQRCQKLREEQIVEKAARERSEVLRPCFGAFQQRWLQQRRTEYPAVRWRAIDQLISFGLIRLPMRVVRERGRAKGGYLSLSRALFKPKATRLLSAWIEKRALEAGTWLNHRPAAAELWRWLRLPVSAWPIWECAQVYAASFSMAPLHHLGLERTSRCTSLAASNARAATGLAAAPNISLNCSGSKAIPPLGPIGGTKPL